MVNDNVGKVCDGDGGGDDEDGGSGDASDFFTTGRLDGRVPFGYLLIKTMGTAG